MSRDEILRLDGHELTWLVAERIMEQDHGPMYSSDRNAAALVLAEIERRGIERQFTCRWFEIAGMDTDKVMRIWDALTASPRDICRAALLAVEGE